MTFICVSEHGEFALERLIFSQMSSIENTVYILSAISFRQQCDKHSVLMGRINTLVIQQTLHTSIQYRQLVCWFTSPM